MSHLRAFWDGPWEGMTQPSHSRLFGNTTADDTFPPFHRMALYPHFHQMQILPQQSSSSEVVNTDEEFRVCIDVQHFKPEEIKITAKDNRIIISARHEERPDEHGFIMRAFTRQYILPKGVDPATVTSSLTREGRLTLKAPKETSIPITKETGDAK